jgi:Amiloride-sensitive sodium channel
MVKTHITYKRDFEQKIMLLLFLEQPGVKLCGLNDKKCIQMAIRRNAEENINENESSGCHCLQTCTSISYDAEISHVRYAAKFR